MGDVPRVADPTLYPERVRQFTEKVGLILNSLEDAGYIVRGPNNTYVLAGGSSVLTTKGDILGYDTAPNRIPVGSNGDVLTADSTQPLGVKWDSGGGGGGTNAWEHPFTTPTIAGTIFVNTTGFTMSDDTNGLFLWNGSLSGSDNLCLGHLAVPGSGAWDATVRIQGLWGDSGFACGGVHLYETSTGKVITFSNQATSGGQRLCVNYFSSVTTFSSQPKTVPCTGRPTWLRAHYDGSANFTFFWSFDGYSWLQYGSTFSKTALFTSGASHAGFFLDPNDSNIITGVKCMSLTVA